MTTSRASRTSRPRRKATEREGGRTADTAPRTLAEELRARPDDALTELLRARPDLLNPVPNDLTQLATRAATRASVVRAVERLDRFALQTAEALAVAPDPCPYETLHALMAGDRDGSVGGATENTKSTKRDTKKETAKERGKESEEATVAGAGDDTGEDTDEDTGSPTDAAGGTADAALDAASAAAIAAALPRAVATLRAQALIWGGDDRLRLVRTARELLAPTPSAPSPTGLGPTVAEAAAGMSPGRLQEILAAAGLAATHDPVSAVAALSGLFGDRARMAALLAEAPREALGVLGRLAWGPPYGEVSVASPSAPVEWLMARGLLLPSGARHVVLPREVALHLRGGRAHRAPEPVPPALVPAAEHHPQAVDATAAGQAFTALATVEELLKRWETGSPLVLRSGGLSVRDLKRTATGLDVSEPVAAFWIELAYAAGLLASDGDIDERYAPTPAYDDWLALPAAERWTALATAWLTATRTAGVVGGRDAKGRTLSALGPDLDRSPAPEVRRRALALLATLPAGTSATPDSLLARLRWERPPRGAAAGRTTVGATRPQATGPAPETGTAASGAGAGTWTAATRSTGGEPGHAHDLRSRLAGWTLAEAELLGVTGRGALSAHGRALLGPLPPHPHQPPHPHPDTSGTAAESRAAAAEAARLLAPLLPQPLDHVLLQADLTAVAPGPLERPLADTLGVLAEVESKGGATVYRFTPESVRRALDAGQSASDLHAFLARHSRTPVPQPLAYLIDDVARKHGRLRIGAASAYLRCDDDALLAEILADRRSVALRLRRLAPTVLAAQVAPDVLLDGLRAMGYAPAAESAEGDVVVTRADAHRTPPRTAPAPVPDGPPLPDDTLLGAAVRAIRAGDLAATTPHKPLPTSAARPAAATSETGLPRTTAADTLATVQAAALTGSAVWIGYVSADGAASQRVIAPIRVEGGFVTAYDHTADEVRTYPLHRITGAAELADEAD
ncbi:helicase C-terminal domain-containing protein [Streptomyces sp. LX-29]|uniref:helicase C-terminal domain-containing protein n=1 Tax=Streptomyces sp. LX-29 TaxID=2900152 RepID=UPI00240D9CC9|nr:helicase C-terminal domain-containing protein [Streptomyces sp. LX-29]WFB08856.1 helicase C-terminal domain-containing protein [Streptomyces sp. LX-29]